MSTIVAQKTLNVNSLVERSLPLYGFCKKPFIKWGSMENGQEVKNSFGTQTGAFFKTGENAYPGYNILVVDLDTDDDGNKIGLKEYCKWVQENEKSIEEQKKYFSGLVLTGSGGNHIYFTYPDGMDIRNSASKILPKVDVRANGGIIVLPGTKVEKNGNIVEYKTQKDENGDSYEDIKPIPGKLLELIVASQKPLYIPPVYNENTVSINDSSMEPYRKKVLISCVEELENAVNGTRNDTLIKVATKAGSYGLDEELAYNEFSKAALSIGMDNLEFTNTFARGFRYGSQNLKELPKKNTIAGDAIMDNNSPKEEKNEAQIAREFEIDSELRNLFEFEYKNVCSYYLQDRKKFIVWDDIHSLWFEHESADSALIDFRRKRINEFKEEAKSKRLNIVPFIRKVENANFLAGGEKVIKAKQIKFSKELNSYKEDEILVGNGVLEISTGKLKENKKEYFYTKRMNASYMGEYNILKNNEEYKEAVIDFEKIISNFGSKEMQRYMQGVLGSGLLNRPTKTTKSYWWHSSGGSGKSAVTNTLRDTFGDYASRPKGTIFIAGTTDFGMQKLEGSRIALLEEAPTGFLDASRLKSVVGSKEVSLANKNEKERDVPVTWKVHIMTNNLPKVRPSEFDRGTLRRILIIPFLKKHKGKNDEIHLMDAGENPLVRNLCLAWLVDGAKFWLSDAKFEDKYPEEVKIATESWKSGVTSDADPLQTFIEDNLVKDERYFINANTMFEAYQEWCERNGVRNKKNSMSICNEIGEKLGVEFTPKARIGDKIGSHPTFLLNESGYEENPNKQKKRLFGFKFIGEEE